MKITKLILHKNKRLHLLEDDTFTFVPENQHTVLRGTSGIGKSTILYELSPLPAHLSQYDDGGYKEIHLTYQSKDYVLISSGKGAGTHQFIVDGEDLNDGGTRTAQLNLVEEHFKYTPKIHDIMMGITRFTRMTGNDRRYWLSTISHTDSEFAMSLWDTIRSKFRDQQGILKETKASIAEYEMTIASNETLDKLAKEKQAYQDIIDRGNSLLAKYQCHDATSSGTDIEQLQDETLEHMSDIYQRCVDSFRLLPELSQPVSYQNVKESIDTLTRQFHELKSEHDKDCTRLEEVIQQISSYSHESSISLTDIEQFLKKNKREQEEWQSTQKKSEQLIQIYQDEVERHDTKLILQKLNYILEYPADTADTIHHHLSLDTEYQTPLYHRYKEYHKNLDARKEIVSKLATISNHLTDHENHLSELQKNPVHSCPKCETRFRSKSVEDSIQKSQQAIRRLHELKEKGEKRRGELDDQVQKGVESAKIYELLSDTLFGDSSRLYPILTMFQVQPTVTDTESKWMHYHEHRYRYPNLIFRLQTDASALLKYIRLKEEEKHLLSMYAKGIKATSPEYTKLHAEQTQLEERTVAHRQKLKSIKQDIVSLKHADELVANITAACESIHDIYDKLLESMDIEMKSTYAEAIRTAQSKMTELIHQVDKQLQHQSGIKYILNHLYKTEENTTVNLGLYEEMMKLLNPKDGLIARSMVGFIRAFISEMNHYIAHVWTYPLVIDVESSDTFTKDYHFPVIIGGDEGHISKDVFLTSNGQSEMIDLAFRLVFAKYLGLDKWPIYADELGGTLNASHRNNLYLLLKRLTEDGHTHQLFVITHLDDIEAVMDPSTLIELGTSKK